MKVTFKHIVVLLLAAVALRAPARSEDTLEALSRQAGEAMAAGKFKEAEVAFARIVADRPEIAEAHSNLGAALYSQDRFTEAVAALRKALDRNPKLDRARVLLGFSYFGLAEFEKCSEVLKTLSGASATPQVLERLALSYLKVNEVRKGLEVLEAWKAKDPANPDVLYHLGQTHTQLALRNYEALKQSAPDSARFHQLQAELHEQQGHLEAAIAEYRTAIAKSPHMAGLRSALGKLCWQNKRYEEAERELVAELQLNPNDAQSNYLLGNIALQDQSLATAEKYLRRALLLAPDLAAAHSDLGLCRRLRDDNSSAEQHLLRAAELAPGEEQIHYRLFDLYRRMGRRDDAARELAIHQQLQKQSRESAARSSR